MSDRTDALKKSHLFSCLDVAGLAKIAAISHFKDFPKKETIFREGAPALGFFIVARGKVKVVKLSLSGAERILHLVGEGGSFAEAVVFGRLERYPAYAEALSSARVLFIPKKDFLDLMKSDFSLTLAVVSSLSEKLKAFNDLVEELSLKDAPSRLAKYFLDLAFKEQDDSFALEIKKTELAKKLGIVPETLSRLLRRFKSKRLIRCSRDTVTLIKKDILQGVASGEKL
jgi:CRP/FNR family transcriptional regulator